MFGLACHNYESTSSQLPSAGEGTNRNPNILARQFFPVSTFTAILPLVDQQAAYNQYNFAFHYTATPTTSGNVNTNNALVAQTKVPVYLCPSNSMTQGDAFN